MRNPFRRPDVTHRRGIAATSQLLRLEMALDTPPHAHIPIFVAKLLKYGSWWSLDRERGLALLDRAAKLAGRHRWPSCWEDGRCLESCNDGPRCSRAATQPTGRCAQHHRQIVRYCCVRRALNGRMAPALVDRVWLGLGRGYRREHTLDERIFLP